MESTDSEQRASCTFGHRSSSDVVVRLRTHGRDEWLYCHSNVLVKNCKYFADRLSENWPICQIIDSRNCVEVYCLESEFNHHVTVLRLFYIAEDASVDEMWHGVKNALGILRVAHELGCPRIVTTCVSYLEAVPWEDSEEEEILKTIPRMGSQVESILSRLQPVNPSAVRRVFLSSVVFATSSPPLSMNDVKSSAQEQLEYMLTEDDDSPLLIADDEIKSKVRYCVNQLFSRFNNLIEAMLCEPVDSSPDTWQAKTFESFLSDLLWASQILTKLEIMRDFVHNWMDSSDKIVKIVEQAKPTIKNVKTYAKAIEVAAKVLEAIGYGTVILPTAKRLRLVQIWLPFVRAMRPPIDSLTTGENDNDNDDDDNSVDYIECDPVAYRVDSELWQSLESTFVSIILALPSSDQAEILSKWLGDEQGQYPDLTEAFEVWCYRSKVAKRRLSLVGIESNETAKTL